jgi:Zn-dependent protease with chaperone function
MELRSPQTEAAVPVRQTETVAVPTPSALAVRYHRSGNFLWAVSTGLSLIIPALLLFTALSARLRGLAQRVGRRWFLTVAIYAVLFTVVTALLTLPLTYYEEFVRQHAYGLSNQAAGRWLGSWLKGVAVSGLGLALVLWIPYLLLRRSPRRWWLYAGLATVPLATLVLVVTPIWVDPLFNDFGPMKDKALEARILALAERAGIDGGRVYEVDKSVDTKTVNAYVTGLGRTKRIVLWDTILARLEPEQVLFVTAHEMGHFVLGHTFTFIFGAAALITVSLYVVHRTAGVLIARFSGQFGFSQLSDVASSPLLLLLVLIVSLILVPALLALSRYHEHEADRFALEVTRNNYAAATTFVRLQQENLAVPRPGPLYMLWRGSHPALGDRIDFANVYRPWETNDRLRYEHVIRPAK